MKQLCFVGNRSQQPVFYQAKGFFRVLRTTMILSLWLAPCFLSFTLQAQDKAKAKSASSIVWYGIDFSLAKFTLVTEDPAIIVNQYIPSINSLIQAEPEKFDLKKWFNKTEVSISLEQVNARNAKIDPSSLVITEEHSISLDDVKKVVAKYSAKDNAEMGLVFVAENLHKVKQTGSYYVCFFNPTTKEIVDAQRYEVKAVGIGFRNYWAGSVYNIMKIWLKQ
jgi:hypothetical protein